MALPNFKMFRSDTLAEVGTDINPIDLGLCLAGATTFLPYQILLYNDKDALVGSEDAKELELGLLQMNLIQSWISTGGVGQTFTLAATPLVVDSEEVTVNGIKWRRVDAFAGFGSGDEIYTLDYSTGVLTFGNGVNGKIPPTGNTIQINYVPDQNIYGKTVYENLWFQIKSSGVVQNTISITSELASKLDDSHINVVHFPSVVAVVGVWDNPAKTGTNYYTGGSFVPDTGAIILGTPITGSTPYVEYTYTIKDDSESAMSVIGRDNVHECANRVPKNNAKILFLSVTVPATASTEGGVFIRVRLRVYYSF